MSRLRDLGDRYNAFIERHDIAWELTMSALAIVFVVVGLRLEGVEAAGGTDPTLLTLDLILTVIFVAEFPPGSPQLGAGPPTCGVTGSTQSP